MKKLITLVVIVAVLAGTSSAAVTNPDGLEGYTPGTFPTLAEGWQKTFGVTVPTVTAAGGLGATQGMLAGNAGGGKIQWDGGNTDGGQQTFEFDFNLSSTYNSRFGVSGGTSDIAWGGFGGGYGAFSLTADDFYGGTIKMWGYENVGGSGGTNTIVTTHLPGATDGLWRNNGWHHITIEMDFATSLVRAQFDTNAFTAWVGMPNFQGYTVYAHESARFENIDDYASDGADLNLDNLSWTVVPEPATMALLGLGALVLRRKRS